MVTSTFQQLDPKKQRRIFSAALTEFARSGYHGASVNTIVERLGIAKGSIFNYFSDKEGLFLFVFEEALRKVKDHLKGLLAATRDQDLFTRLESSLLGGVAFIRSHPRIFQLYLRVHYESGPRRRREIIRSVRAYGVKYLTILLTDAKARGEIPEDLDITRAAFFLDAVLERFLQAYGVAHVDAGLGLFKADDKEVRVWARTVVSFLRSGLLGGGKA